MANEALPKLAGKSALITGGSRGIGKAVARAYASEGARVFICGRDAEALAASAAEIAREGGEARWRVVDLNELDATRGLVPAALDAFGALDILVNNASLLGPRVELARYPLPEWEAVLRVNVTAPFVLIQEALKAMLPRGRGSIINVSSGVGRVGRARWGAYAVSKFGIEALTQILAEELSGTGVRVNAVNPGGTRTRMRAEAYPEETPETLPSPEEIAPVFVYLASEESRALSGKSLDARDWLKARSARAEPA
jgi:NAD(P)-dependent dehydrogenase (short-subunit alcohol dehydrogenase family)